MLCDMLVAHYEEIIMHDLIFFLSPPDMSIKNERMGLLV